MSDVLLWVLWAAPTVLVTLAAAVAMGVGMAAAIRGQEREQ